MKATTLDLRRRMRDVLRALERNETVTLTHRGHIVGTIHPAARSAKGKRRSIMDDPIFGMWADRQDMKDPSEWLRKQRSRGKQRLRAIWHAKLPRRTRRTKPRRAA